MVDCGQATANGLPTRGKGRWVRTALGLAVSVVLLWWMARFADVREVASHLAGVSPVAIIAAILIGYLAMPLRVVQWQLLLGNPAGVTFLDTLRAICLGHVGNFVLPMRGGELVKSFLLSRTSRLSFPRVLASVALARLQDLPPVLAIVGLVMVLLPVDASVLEQATDVLGVPVHLSRMHLVIATRTLALTAACGALGLFVCYRWWQPICATLTRATAKVWPALATRLESILASVGQGIAVVAQGRAFWGAQAIAFVCWVLFCMAPIPLLMAFSLGFRQACATAVAATGISTIAHMLPSAPGAVGTYHAFCFVAVVLCNPGMDPNAAVAYTVVAHLVGTLSPALPGLLFLPGAWDHLGDLRRAPSHD